MSSTQKKTSPVKIVPLHPGMPFPDQLCATPGGTLFSTTPGGTRIIYDRTLLLQLKASPGSKLSPNGIHLPSEISAGGNGTLGNGFYPGIRTLPPPQESLENDDQFAMD